MYQRLGRRHPWYATSDEAWEEWFSLLREFHSTFGHLTIDRELVFQSQPLGKWCHNQRINYLRQGLSQKRVQRLRRLGLSLDEADNSQHETHPSFSFRAMADSGGNASYPPYQFHQMQHHHPPEYPKLSNSWTNDHSLYQNPPPHGAPGPRRRMKNPPSHRHTMNHYQHPHSQQIHPHASKDIENRLVEEQKQNQLLSETIRVLQEELQESKKNTRRARSRLSEVSHQTFADHQKNTSTNAREVSKLRAENVALLRKLNEQTRQIQESESSTTQQQQVFDDELKKQTDEVNRLVVENFTVKKSNEKLLQKQRELEAQLKIRDPPAEAHGGDLSICEINDTSSKGTAALKEQLQIKQGTVDKLRQENILLNEEIDEKDNLLTELKKENESLRNASSDNGSNSSYPHTVETLEKQVRNLERHLKESNALLAASQESMNELEKQFKDRQGDAERQKDLESRLEDTTFELQDAKEKNERLQQENVEQAKNASDTKAFEAYFNEKLQNFQKENASLKEEIQELHKREKLMRETHEKEKQELSTMIQSLKTALEIGHSKETSMANSTKRAEKENFGAESKSNELNLPPTPSERHGKKQLHSYQLERSRNSSCNKRAKHLHDSSSKPIACPESPSVASTECGVDRLDKEIRLSKVLSPRISDQNRSVTISSAQRGTPSTNYKMHAAKLLARRASGILPERRRIFETSCAISPQENSDDGDDAIVSSLVLCENGENQFHHPGANLAPPSSVMNNKKRSRIQETAATLLEPNAKRRFGDV